MSLFNVFKSFYTYPPTFLGIMPDDKSKRAKLLNSFFSWLIQKSPYLISKLRVVDTKTFKGNIYLDKFSIIDFIVSVDLDTAVASVTLIPKGIFTDKRIVKFKHLLPKNIFNEKDKSIYDFINIYKNLIDKVIDKIVTIEAQNISETLLSVNIPQTFHILEPVNYDIDLNTALTGMANINGNEIDLYDEIYRDVVLDILRDLNLQNKYKII